MAYTYSICYPDKAEIEYKNNIISADEALNIAKNHPWREQLELMDKLEDNIHFNPSLDFRSTKDGKSFALTANYDDRKQLEFSLWFEHLRKIKVFFGLFGEKEEMGVDDIWSIDFEAALKYLQHFLNGEYEIVESLFNNK